MLAVIAIAKPAETLNVVPWERADVILVPSFVL